jgi:hypothetical protein
LHFVKIVNASPFGINAPGTDVSGGYASFYVNLDTVSISIACGTGECAGIHFHGPLSGTIKDVSITVTGTGTILNGILGDLTNVDFQGLNSITVTGS